MAPVLVAAFFIAASAGALSAAPISFAPVKNGSPFSENVGPSVLPKPLDGGAILDGLPDDLGGFGLVDLPPVDLPPVDILDDPAPPVAAVPAPPALLMLLTGLGALAAARFGRARR